MLVRLFKKNVSRSEGGIGKTARTALRALKTNQEALEAVKAEHPHAETTIACINWYRHELRAAGEDVPTARALKAMRKAAPKDAA